MHKSLEAIMMWYFVAILAWAPFPLGSNRQWSAALLICLIAFAYGGWVLIAENVQQTARRYLKRLAAPLLLALFALAWGMAQVLPIAPEEWIHPIWPMASEALGQKTAGAITLDPWRTGFAFIQLAAYVLAFFLVVLMSAEERRANLLLDAVIFIGAAYSVYGIALSAFEIRQFEFFYSSVPVGSRFAGPFVLHNSYATFAGLAAVAAIARLFALAGNRVRTAKGGRAYALSLLDFFSGRGLFYLLAFILCFSTIVFSASRAGVAAAIFALVVLLLLASPVAARRGQGMLATGGAATIIVVLAGLLVVSGDNLQRQLDALVQAGGADSIRAVAWDAALRMIRNSPLLGLGLGTFETAFPLYASESIPFVLDKAHNDWLEFAAGLGVPAAAAWWVAMAWLTLVCIRAVYVRHRHRVYAAVAVGATALVAFHSAFDFSLQIPAVALTYATLMGLGIAQAFPTRTWQPSRGTK